MYSNYPSPLKKLVKEGIASLSIVGCNITINAADSGCKHYVILGNLSRSKALYIFSVSPPYIYNHLLFQLRARPQLSPLHAKPGATPPPRPVPAFLSSFVQALKALVLYCFYNHEHVPLNPGKFTGNTPLHPRPLSLSVILQCKGYRILIPILMSGIGAEICHLIGGVKGIRS